MCNRHKSFCVGRLLLQVNSTAVIIVLSCANNVLSVSCVIFFRSTSLAKPDPSTLAAPIRSQNVTGM